MSESHGIEIPSRPPAGVVMALKEFVEEVERYDTDGVWPDNGIIRRLADQGRAALNNSPKSVGLAEKEKEVAWLRKALEEKDAMSATIAQQDALLEEAKRVLAIAQLDVCYMCCPAKPTDGRDWVHEEECESVRQLLTRLGGASHE